jgi:hypothetical protein
MTILNGMGRDREPETPSDAAFVVFGDLNPTATTGGATVSA